MFAGVLGKDLVHDKLVESDHGLFRHQFGSHLRPGDRWRPILTATIEFFQELRVIDAPGRGFRRNGTQQLPGQLQTLIIRQLESRLQDLITADVHGYTLAGRDNFLTSTL